MPASQAAEVAEVTLDPSVNAEEVKGQPAGGPVRGSNTTTKFKVREQAQGLTLGDAALG